MASIKCLTISIILSCMAGLILCWYAFYIEMSKELNHEYEALCDLNEHISCSKVLTSPYGRGFGLIRYITGENSAWNQPNPIFGAALYISILMLTQGKSEAWAYVQVIMCIIANIGSVYLAVILFVVLQDLCLVCISTYAVNAVLLMLAWCRYKAFMEVADRQAAQALPERQKKKNQ